MEMAATPTVTRIEPTAPIETVDLVEFRRLILAMNLFRASEFEKYSPESPGGAVGLARKQLVRAGS